MKSTTVGEIMTPDPVTLHSDAKLSEAWDLMETRHILHIPIVDDGVLVGLLSERQMRDAMPSIILMSDPEGRQKSLRLTRVSQVWHPGPRTVAPTTTVLDAIKTMRRDRLGSLPVLNEGRLVGILTAGDLISFLERLLNGGP